MRDGKDKLFYKRLAILLITITLCLAGFTIIPVVNADCPDGLINYWTFDSISGNTVYDVVGIYDGTATNGPTINPAGKVGNSYSFDGIDDYIDCGDIDELNSVSSFTIMGWYKDNSIGGHNRHFDKGDGGNNDISGATYNNNLYIEVGNGANTYAYWSGYSSTISTGEWYHAAFVFDGSGATNTDKAKIYFNGIERSLSFGGGSMPTTTADLSGDSFMISKSHLTGNPWDGEIDEVAIFDKALSPSEISDIYDRSFLEICYCVPDTVYVDDDYDSSTSGWQHEYFDNIQDGVDAVEDGGTIYVYSGTYQEQVHITKNVDIYGIVSTGTKPLIQPPVAATRTTYTIPESTRTFDPIIFADGGTGAIDITISNFEIDGLDDGGSNTFCGMLLRNTASGPINSKWITNNEIHSLWGTGQETMGIIMYGANTDKIIHGNTVSGFSRNGITAIDGVISINSNTVTGNGPLPTGNWAQNGIQVSAGATGNVIGNTVSDCSILNPNWAASGILCYLSGGSVNVNSNNIFENEVNVYLASCSANVRGNTVYATGAGTGQTYFYGIIGDPGEGTPVPAPSPYMDEYIAYTPLYNPLSNTLTYYMICQSNTVESDSSSGGVGIGCYAGMYGTYDIYLTIDNNDILNWETGIELYEYTPNIIAVANIHCNNIIGNTYGIYNWLTKTFNANCNWWGDISGPYHPTANPTGLGDPVSDYIDFVPWTGKVVAEAGGPYEDDNCDYTVTFDGSSSYVYCPCDPETLSYSWDFDDSDGIQVDSTEMNPTHTYVVFGEYTVTLTVTGSIYGGTNTDTATVKIYGAVADAGGPYYTQDSLKVKFDGSGSTGFEAPLTYDWDFGDGSPHGTGVTPTHTYSSYGTYTVTLTVTESGNSCTDINTTTVRSQRDPPIVTLIYPEGGETIKDTITIEWWAHDSQDEYEMPIYLYYFDDTNNWYQINDELENTGEYEWDTTSLPDGTYRLLAEAVDSDNNIGHDESEPFQIKNHEEPPENLAPNKPDKPSGPAKGKAGEEYSYSSSTSDPDGDQIWYMWDWGDGSNSGWLGPDNSGETCEASHIWGDEDDYSIRVKAKDEYGKESTWSEPLGISMPVNKHVSNPLFRQILNRLVERFPVFARLLSLFPMFNELLDS